jgi:hypothetical protein
MDMFNYILIKHTFTFIYIFKFLEKNRKGPTEGWNKLERGKRSSLRQNQMEELHKGPVFHTGTKGEEEEEEITIYKFR